RPGLTLAAGRDPDPPPGGRLVRGTTGPGGRGHGLPAPPFLHPPLGAPCPQTGTHGQNQYQTRLRELHQSICDQVSVTRGCAHPFARINRQVNECSTECLPRVTADNADIAVRFIEMEASGRQSGDQRFSSSRTPWLASASARSFRGSPAWPLTQRHSTSCCATRASSACQRSALRTGFLSAVRQPRRFQLGSHSLIPFCTYCESV